MALASKKVVQTSSGDTRPVSPHSVWSDRVWKYNHVAPGQRDSHAQVDWGAIENLRGENLYDHGPAELREEFRTFVDSWINEPHESALGPGSLSGVEVTLRAMFEWMSDEHIMSVGEIDEETSWSYVDWLHGNYDVVRDDERMGGRPRELTHASAYRAINTLLKLYEQRAPMRRAGVATVPERPFGPDSTALSFVVAEMGLPRVGKLQPNPGRNRTPRADGCSGNDRSASQRRDRTAIASPQRSERSRECRLLRWTARISSVAQDPQRDNPGLPVRE